MTIIENMLNGTNSNDHIIGGNDVAWGGKGNDVIFGEAGDDVLAGEAGNDIVMGGADNDLLFGEDGNDYLDGGVLGLIVANDNYCRRSA